MATNSAREDKKQKLLIFVKCQRKEPFLSGIAPFRCRIPPPMRHLNDRNATPRHGNATPFSKYFLYICSMIARLEPCRFAVRHTCSSYRQASYSFRNDLRSDDPMGMMVKPIPSLRKAPGLCDKLASRYIRQNININHLTTKRV